MQHVLIVILVKKEERGEERRGEERRGEKREERKLIS
jgi:hypothetical protein